MPRKSPLTDQFAQELEMHDLATGDRGGDVAVCAARLGISQRQGNQILQRLRRKLGKQAN